MHQHLPEAVTYDGESLTIIDHHGQPWLTAADLSRALGYADTRSVTRIWSRHSSEFTEGMCGVVNLTTPGNPMPIPVRIFSPRGCHLIAMFAHTARAAAFRRWVLDVLERLEKPAPGVAALPLPEAEAALLAAQLDAIRVRFCGGRAPGEEIADLQQKLNVARDALHAGRLQLERAERALKEPEPQAQQPSGLALAAASDRERRAQRRLEKAGPPTTPLTPERQQELESLRRSLDDPPRT